MKEFIEKLIGRLEEKVVNRTFDESIKTKNLAYKEAIEIVNQLAEEYNNDFCEWEYDEFETKWQTDCGVLFALHDSDREITQYCPCCGKKNKGGGVMGVPKDYTGKKYGMLTPIQRLGKSKNGYYIWLCKCDCGNMVERTVDVFNRGKSSCGCASKRNRYEMSLGNITHNMSKTRLYGIYKNMVSRCYREKDIHYPAYGARGITICDEWLNDRTKFFEWALSNGYSDELTIERKDNDKGYSPENCTWVTKQMQYKNKRQNLMITYNGKTLCAEDWSKETGIPATTIRWRFKHGWEVERIFENELPEPYQPKGE